MSVEDPFFVVKDEVLKALIKTRGLFERWKNCSDNNSFLDKNRQSEEREWASTELKNALRSIEWDLEDLEDTVNIVEKNPTKFRIDVAELEVRKKFILQTKEEVRIMKAKANQMNSHTPAETPPELNQVSLTSPVGGVGNRNNDSSSSGNNTTKYTRLPIEDEDDSPKKGGGSYDSIRQEQQELSRNQDDQLVMMSESVGNLRNISSHIGNELDEQAVMLDEFGTEIENAESKLDATMRKMSKVLHVSNDRRQWIVIGGLLLTVIVLFFLILLL